MRVHAAGHRLFVKAIGGEHPLAVAYDNEARTVAALPAAALRPELIWAGRVDGWIAMVLQDIPGRHPDLSPGSADIPLVVAAVAAMSSALDPSPITGAAPAATARCARPPGSSRTAGWSGPARRRRGRSRCHAE